MERYIDSWSAGEQPSTCSRPYQPLRREFIDFEGRIERILPTIEEMVGKRLITTTTLRFATLSEFIQRAAELSAGNPGSMISMLEMARQPRYRSAEHIKITPLYVDFRIKWNASTHA